MDTNRISCFLGEAFNVEVLIKGRYDNLYGYVVLGKENHPYKTEERLVLNLLNDVIFSELWNINQENHYYDKSRTDIPLSETIVEFRSWKQNQTLMYMGDKFSLDLKGLEVFSTKEELIDGISKDNHPLNRLYFFRYTMNTFGGTEHEGIVFSLSESLKSLLSTGHTLHSNL